LAARRRVFRLARLIELAGLARLAWWRRIGRHRVLFLWRGNGSMQV